MVAAAGIGGGVACRGGRVEAGEWWQAVAGFPCRLWATTPHKSFGGFVGLSCGSVECQPQRSC